MTVRAQYRYQFTPGDVERYKRNRPCDWCGFAFVDGHEVTVDHSHLCECATRLKKGNSCQQCLRGFVHLDCNKEISALEWRRSAFGERSKKLDEYLKKFPTPRFVNKLDNMLAKALELVVG